jgi:protoporphyrinogen/coproporphyrinogen III oxidase
MAEVVIIGGGISGLSAAYRLLSDKSFREGPIGVTLIEESSRLGGALCTEKQGEFVVEHGADSFITNKPWAKQLCLDLGLKDEIVETSETNRRSLIAFKGELHPVPDGFRMIAPTLFWPFVKSDLFTWAGKLRVAMELFTAKGQPQDDESVSSFVARHFGHELLERAAQPLVGGIYTGNVNELSAQATLPVFVDLEAKYGSVIRGLKHEEKDRSQLASGARYAMFNSLRDGVGALIDRLAKQFPADRLLLNSTVLSLRKTSQKWAVVLADGSTVEADAVIITTAASQAGLLLETIDPDLAALLKNIQNASSVVINFLFRRKDVYDDLKGFGFVVPSSENRSIIAVSAISAKYENRAPEEMLMLRVFMGGSLDHNLNRLDEHDLKQLALSDINSYLKTRSDPIKSWFKRWPESMPQYNVGHKLLVAQIQEKLEGQPRLALAGNSYEGVGIPDCIMSAEKAVKKTIKSLQMSGLLTN